MWNRIQLIGQGAGAASIIHHYTYRSGGRYRPRFNGAILLSPGFAESPSNEELNKKYAEILSAAKVKDLDGLAACDSSKLQKINRDQISKSGECRLTLGPTTGSEDYPDSPAKFLKAGKFFSGIPVLTGYTTKDVSNALYGAAIFHFTI